MSAGGRLTGSERRSMQDALLAEMLDEIRAERSNNTETFAQLRSSITNDVLDSGAYVLDANGLATQSYQTPFGSIFVENLGLGEMTLAGSPPATSAPTRGRSVHIIPPRSGKLINLAGTAWTLYGAAGDLADVQVFTRPWPPSAAGQLTRSGQTATLVTADPAAGQEVSATVPAGQTWELRAVRLTLVTSATVANRRVHLVVDDGTNIIVKLPANLQTASSTINYDYGVGLGAAALSSDFTVPLAGGLVLRAGYRVRTATDLIDAGDDYAAAVIYFSRLA